MPVSPLSSSSTKPSHFSIPKITLPSSDKINRYASSIFLILAAGFLLIGTLGYFSIISAISLTTSKILLVSSITSLLLSIFIKKSPTSHEPLEDSTPSSHEKPPESTVKSEITHEHKFEDPKKIQSNFFRAIYLNKVEEVKNLIRKGAEINKVDEHGGPPLARAVSYGYIEIIKVLLARNADVEKVNEFDETPLMIAVNNEEIDIINLLIKEGKANINNEEKYLFKGRTALMKAVEFNKPKVVQTLIDNGANIETTYGFSAYSPLQKAVNQNNLEIVEILIKARANVNYKDKSDWTALMHAISLYERKKGKEKDDALEIIKTLIQAGADKNLGKDKLTALSLAKKYKLDEIVSILENK